MSNEKEIVFTRRDILGLEPIREASNCSKMKKKKSSKKEKKSKKKKKYGDEDELPIAEQIKLLRWEVLQMKTQGAFDSELDNHFSKEGSSRTMQTWVGSEEFSHDDVSEMSFPCCFAKMPMAPAVSDPYEIVFNNPDAMEEEEEEDYDDDDGEEDEVVHEQANILVELCRCASWFLVRQWLDKHESNDKMVRQCIMATNTTREPTTALHVMCTKRPPRYLVKWLADLAPDACKMRDYAGRLPIHCAIATGADGSVVDALIKAYPASLRIADKTGLLPTRPRSR